ncbi:hypothetical protein Pcinc_026453 [Petrolisthes cinctipes]|uniref:Large ribosomal subunit protein uL30m n=1 Tax=Petrolisthes cinctipes TaxID=88211 RepID=A0AAE1K841_PETCI|nr:hypothetical protein Pcinc_026453 [Petrolisthes cinctipes]
MMLSECAGVYTTARHSSWLKSKRKLPTRVDVIPKMKTPTWSTGEVSHPGPQDCPLGNKGDYPYNLPDGGRQYFGFKYYPRYADEVDPPYKPTPLHLVTRTRCLKKKPWWDRDIMKRIGLDGKRSTVTILKNNPENNAMLWKVKHMVKVTPIHLPPDLPDDADPNHCFIKENGEFVYSHAVGVEDAQLEDTTNSAVKWNQKFVDTHTRKNWDHPWQLKLC